MVDFSYKRPVLDKMAEQARSLIVLDHHKSAMDDLADIPEPPPYIDWIDGAQPVGFSALFDMKRSGAGITCDYFEFYRGWFIEYIEDRDLWKRSLPGVDMFTMALRSYPQDFHTWSNVLPNTQEMIQEGEHIHRYYRTLIDAFKKTATRAIIAGYDVPVVNTPFHFASELAGELAEVEPFAACYWYHPYGCTFSLRSRSDGIDVSEVAKQYGGGGHPDAAGFKLDWEKAWKIITKSE